MTEQVRKASVLAWLIVTGIIVVILLTPYILPERMILSGAYRCRSPEHTAGRCALCGMTRAFLDISRGNVEKALSYNHSSLLLYSLFVANELFAFLYIGRKIRKWHILRSRGVLCKGNKESNRRC